LFDGVEYPPVPHSYRVIADGIDLRLSHDHVRAAAVPRGRFPAEAAAIRRCFRVLRAIRRDAGRSFGLLTRRGRPLVRIRLVHAGRRLHRRHDERVALCR
jgi:hypothetical protein